VSDRQDISHHPRPGGTGAAWDRPDQARPERSRPDRPAGVFASYAGPNRPSGIRRKSMFAIYIALLVVTAGLGVFAAYQWERQKDASDRAELVAVQNEALSVRVAELESLAQGLADLAAVTYDSDPQGLLARLDDLEERSPNAAAMEIFTKLWIGAKDRELQTRAQGEPQFETASRGDGGQRDLARDRRDAPPPEPKAEPARQDQANGAPAQSDFPSDGGSSGRSEDRNAGARASADPSDVLPSEIVIAAKEETWIQILAADGTPVFTKLMKAGDQHKVTIDAGLTLITGNPTGLALSIDGATAPAFNAKGPVRRVIALDPERLLEGTAEQPAKESVRSPSPDAPAN